MARDPWLDVASEDKRVGFWLAGIRVEIRVPILPVLTWVVRQPSVKTRGPRNARRPSSATHWARSSVSGSRYARPIGRRWVLTGIFDRALNGARSTADLERAQNGADSFVMAREHFG